MVDAGIDIDRVIEIRVDDEEMCQDSVVAECIRDPVASITYSQSSRFAGVDNESGEALVQRDDDKEETVRKAPGCLS
jgi:adenylate kinase